MILNLKNIFDYIEADYDKLAQNQIISYSYLLCGQQIKIEYASFHLYQVLHSAIAHLQSEYTDKPDLLIRVMEKKPASIIEGDIWLNANTLEPASNFISADGELFMQRTAEGALSIVDRSSNRAYYWIRDLNILPYWETAAPLRIIINWWGIARGLQLLHAAAVGYQGKGILLVGKSGTGKSTTAVNCLAGGMDYLGDDHVILDTNNATEVHSIYATAKLNEDMADLFAQLENDVYRLPQREGEKQIVILPKEMITPALQVSAILVPCITGVEESFIEPAPAMLGVLALAPSTLLYCPGGAEQTLQSLGEMSNRIPTYRLLAGTNRQKLISALKLWIEKSIIQGEVSDND